MRSKYISVVSLAIVLSGCATAHKINRVSVGMTKEDVVQALGEPASISAKDKVEYLNYQLSETGTQAYYGMTTPYFVRIVDGRVDAFGRKGDFDSTNTPTIRIESGATPKQDRGSAGKYDGELQYRLDELKKMKDDGLLSESEYRATRLKMLSK